MDVHELTAGYALDALDPAERETFEEHLSSCERCREELQGFWQVSGALAHAAGGPMPPPSLRDRILAEARSERSNVVPLRRRRVLVPALSSVAAVAAVAAIGIGLWATSLSRDLDRARSVSDVLGDPNARSIESEDGGADLVVAPDGDAVLVVRKLAPAPDGKDYEIWVFEDGTPRRAGLFERPGAALLTRQVEPGQMVAVTLEPDGGLDAPSGAPVLTATST
jgi:anti-sigma-K factor RskA